MTVQFTRQQLIDRVRQTLRCEFDHSIVFSAGEVHFSSCRAGHDEQSTAPAPD